MFARQFFSSEGKSAPYRIADSIGTAAISNVSRRSFLAGTGGIALSIALAGCSTGSSDNKAADGPLAKVKGGDASPALWVAIAKNGAVRITCHRSEMGQQVWTSMAQIVADELDADWKDVEIVQALGDAKYGDQNTDGSRSVRYNFHRLRVAGAAMRHMLVRAAAEEWGVDPAICSTGLGEVVDTKSNKRLSYGELAEAAGKLDVPAEADITLKTNDQWRYIGKPVPSLTVPKIVRGQGTFGIDVDRPGMVYAVVARPPQLFGKTGKVDDAAALKVPGVLKTVRLPDLEPPAEFKALGGVAVVASDTWAAIQGRTALQVEWRDGPNAKYESAAYRKALEASASKPGNVQRKRGDVKAALDKAAKKISAKYYAPHLGQTPMEPPSATAEWTGSKLECWACVQDPQTTRDTLAGILEIPKEDITVHATWLGGAFGRKSKPDFVVEAALIARDVGKPVKVTWTREDDIQHGYFHSVSAQHLEAALDDKGKCTAWLHRSAFPSISSTFAPDIKGPSADEMGLGATDTPFDIPNLQVEACDAEAHVRIGWLRAVSNIYHVFAVQSFVGELALAAGRDQKDYLLDLIGSPRTVDPTKEGAEYSNYDASLEDYPIQTERLSAVVKKAAEMAGWGRSLPKGRGLGIAVHRSFLAYVATVIEVAVGADGKISIPGAWVAVDAGTVINPRHVKAQIEGGTIYALSNALYGELSAKDGAIEQANFPDWRVLRMSEAPRKFAVEIMPSTALPGGVGEPGSPPAAPALGNAIFAATGMRLRNLPFIGPNKDRLALDSSASTQGVRA